MAADNDKKPKLGVIASEMRMLLNDTLRKTPRIGSFAPARRMFVHGYQDGALVVTVQGDEYDAKPELKLLVRLEVEELDG